MSAISLFATNREIAIAATPLVISCLGGEDAYSRALAASVLGTLRVNAESALPSLLYVAENDPDNGVRRVAIKAIGRFGTNATSIVPNLHAIANSNRDERINRGVRNSIRAIEGHIDPDDVR